MAINKIAIFFILLICANCQKGVYFQYKDNSSLLLYEKIHLNKLNVQLIDRTIWPLKITKDSKYLTQTEIENIISEEIIKKLQEDKIYSPISAQNIYESEIKVKFDRMFMMFTDQAYIGTAMRSYEIGIYNKEELIAKKFDSKRKTADLKFQNKIKKLGKTLTFLYNRDGEIEEIKSFAKILANNLEELLRQ